MKGYDFIFAANEAAKQTKDVIENDNKYLLKDIFSTISKEISKGNYSAYYEFYHNKNEWCEKILNQLGYVTSWEEDIELGDAVWFLNISWRDDI